ncbi:anthranilate phosphoribosyltransferase [Paenibacillus sp. IB182496]|uniref:Anthranilate phosphoribosyltransferase n=1 Tax=Paenibacillus sabuli TaxID=2772509 RepID=A0A927BR11_9BACL|nr:anthranilate phosphoribosyltransferase [Paenibacillus sabuli]MBD2845156.1 anthranilate phosphoribosyltransferase [Paenibacillus sabuli]
MTVETIAIPQLLNRLVQGEHLSREQAAAVMTQIMDGAATPAQIGALAAALRMKGETADEIAGFAEVMRAKSNRVQTEQRGLLDTCGTGGSGIHKFNVSTASAIIAASGGIRVAKHGNRAMSGRAGSADVLEALGVDITLTAEQAGRCLEEIGICFMFAQLYHPSLRHAAGPRKELGIRTIFNMLGPLTNPAGADRQLLGIYDRSRTETVARVLQQLGLAQAMIVSSHDGLDEISVSAPTQISELRGGAIRTYDIEPEALGVDRHALSEVAGGDAQLNARLIRAVLEGTERGGYRDIVALNAGACLYVGERSGTLKEGVAQALALIDNGKAAQKLEQLIRTTGELTHVSR